MTTGALDAALARHRAQLARKHRARNPDGLVAVVDALGFAFAFTAEPALPVPACFEHLSTTDESRKWSWIWAWKDELAEAKRLYYGKLIAKKPTFVSLATLPLFYGTFGRAGDADDHVDDVRTGRVSDVGRRIIEFLGHSGETQTKRMRAELGLSSEEGRKQYAKAIDDLQRLMYVTLVRAVGDGREDYNYTYDLFTRRYPEIVRAAEPLSSADALARLTLRLLDVAGGVTEKQIGRLFDWEPERVTRTVAALEAKGAVTRAAGLVLLPGLESKR